MIEMVIYSLIEDQFNAVGLWLMRRFKWSLSQKIYEELVVVLETKEREIGIRLHKGLAYHNIGICLYYQDVVKEALIWLKKAYDEDVLTYGCEGAKTHPAFEAFRYISLLKEGT